MTESNDIDNGKLKRFNNLPKTQKAFLIIWLASLLILILLILEFALSIKILFNNETGIINQRPFALIGIIMSLLLFISGALVKPPKHLKWAVITSTAIVAALVGATSFMICLPPIPAYSNFNKLRAIHEAGHAVIAETISPGSVSDIRLIESWRFRLFKFFGSGTEGFTFSKSQALTRETLSGIKDDICIKLGGIASVTVLMPDDRYAGPSSDLADVDKLIQSAANNGMIGATPIRWDMLTSEQRSKIAQQIISEQFDRAKTIISSRKKTVMAIAEKLLAKNHVSKAELQTIMKSSQ